VVDSRGIDDGGAIRRRRECLGCGHRFTTYERVEESALVVVKRSGEREAFDRTKLMAGLASAAKGRPLGDADFEAVAADVEGQLRRSGGGDVPSERIGLAVLERLRELDTVAYVRFASVYKAFDDPADFERELVLLTKSTEPKRREPVGECEPSGSAGSGRQLAGDRTSAAGPGVVPETVP
jgi:transcriptional repressor NrdR